MRYSDLTAARLLSRLSDFIYAVVGPGEPFYWDNDSKRPNIASLAS